MVDNHKLFSDIFRRWNLSFSPETIWLLDNSKFIYPKQLLAYCNWRTRSPTNSQLKDTEWHRRTSYYSGESSNFARDFITSSRWMNLLQLSQTLDKSKLRLTRLLSSRFDAYHERSPSRNGFTSWPHGVNIGLVKFWHNSNILWCPGVRIMRI